MSGVQRRIFPEAFKREAVERVRSGGLTAGKVAAELGIHETALRRWMKQSSVASVSASLPRPTAQVMKPSLADLSAENGRLRPENDRLRLEREILTKPLPSSGRVQNKVQLRPATSQHLSVRTMCRVLGISSSGYYAWVGRAESKRTAANRQLLDDIRSIHIGSSGTYGHTVCTLFCNAAPGI